MIYIIISFRIRTFLRLARTADGAVLNMWAPFVQLAAVNVVNGHLSANAKAAPMTDPIDTAAVRDLAGKAIGGTWSHVGLLVQADDGGSEPWVIAEVAGCCGIDRDHADDHAAFIAQSRTLIPAMADEIDRLRFDLSTEATLRSDADKAILELRASLAEKDRLLKKSTAAIEGVLAAYWQNTCVHERTYRGGALWTICEECGARWADDEGGFKPFEPSPAVDTATAFLSKLKEHQP